MIYNSSYSYFSRIKLVDFFEISTPLLVYPTETRIHRRPHISVDLDKKTEHKTISSKENPIKLKIHVEGSECRLRQKTNETKMLSAFRDDFSVIGKVRKIRVYFCRKN